MNNDVCEYCGSGLVETGAPIWETYCPNTECDREKRHLKAALKAAKERRERTDPDVVIDKIQKHLNEIKKTFLVPGYDDKTAGYIVEDHIHAIQDQINEYKNRNTISLDPFS